MTMNKIEGSERSTGARERLVSAAIEAFAEKGFAGTTTRDIASRAGMSPAAVYVHHRSKEELLFEISTTGHQAALDVIRRAAESHDEPIARVHAMVGEFSRWHAVFSRNGRIVQYEFSSLSPEHRAEIASYRRQIEAYMQDALTDGVGEGIMHVDDIKGTALALLSLSIDLVRWYQPGGPLTPDDMASLHSRLAIRMIQV